MVNSKTVTWDWFARRRRGHEPPRSFTVQLWPAASKGREGRLPAAVRWGGQEHMNWP